MKKRLVILLLTLVLMTGVIWAGSAYFGFVSQTIYEESTAHLTEIFHQANQTLYNLVSVNWSVLSGKYAARLLVRLSRGKRLLSRFPRKTLRISSARLNSLTARLIKSLKLVS